jgi:fucose 4-O-acetylase-like acetyltransferase
MDARAHFQPETAAIAPSSPDRTQWVDVARGLGIILVVWGHALRAHFDLTKVTWAAVQDRWIYSFHMPLFFILAGLFLWRSIGKGRSQFLKGRWFGIIWPYLLWSFVCGFIEFGLSRYVTSPIGFHELLMIPFAPIEQFWFLYVLLLCQLICLAVYPSKLWLWVVTLAGLILLQFVAGPWIGFRALRYLPFVAVGVTFAAMFKRLAHAGSMAQLALLVGGTSCLSVVLLSDTGSGLPEASLLATGMFGSVALMALSMLIANQGSCFQR